jgi:peptidoglycan/xylan/chitin deacetylase (PgdA/CDA1 family)
MKAADLVGRSVTVAVPATVANLGAGYDVLGLALEMTNELTVQVTGVSTSGKGTVTYGASGEGAEELAHNRTNAVWLSAIPADEERDFIHYCIERVTRATGKRPTGWLSSAMDETWQTLDHLVAEKMLYVTDWVNDDQPYRMQAGGSEIIYLPYSYETNDNAQIVSRFASIDDFELMIKRTFDVLYSEAEDSARVMAICLHPFISGVPHRVAGLDAAFRYICNHNDVWWATGEEIVRAYMASDAQV